MPGFWNLQAEKKQIYRANPLTGFSVQPLEIQFKHSFICPRPIAKKLYIKVSRVCEFLKKALPIGFRLGTLRFQRHPPPQFQYHLRYPTNTKQPLPWVLYQKSIVSNTVPRNLITATTTKLLH